MRAEPLVIWTYIHTHLTHSPHVVITLQAPLAPSINKKTLLVQNSISMGNLKMKKNHKIKYINKKKILC
ncbi:hypothetical protein FKM82_026285 [Ascaphus truei]